MNLIKRVAFNSLKKIPKFKSFSLFPSIKYNVYSIHYDDVGRDGIQSTSYVKEVEKILKEFFMLMQLKGHQGDLIENTLLKMEGAKLGIEFHDPKFIHFLFFIKKFLSSIENTPSQLVRIMSGMSHAGITDLKLWTQITEYISQNTNKFSTEEHLMALYLISEYSITHVLKTYIQENEVIIKKQIVEQITNKQYLNCVYGINALLKCEIEIDDTMATNAIDLLLNDQMLYFNQIRAHDFADFIYIFYSLSQQLNFDIQRDIELIKMKQTKADLIVRYIRESIDCYINLDLNQYDEILKQYEYEDQKTDQIGLYDRLSWGSISKVFIVLSDPLYYDDNAYKRLEDQIFRKCETDVIDLQNAAIILECFTMLNQNNLNIIMQILNMLDARFKAEKERASDLIDVNSAIKLLKAISEFEGTSVVNDVTVCIIQYFGGAIKHGALSLDEDQAFEFKMYFEDCPYTQHDPAILDKLNQIIKGFQEQSTINI